MSSRDDNLLAEAVLGALVSPNEADRNGENANVVDGLFAIARAVHHLARAVEHLGVNDADASVGAVELLSKEIKDGLLSVAAEIANK